MRVRQFAASEGGKPGEGHWTITLAAGNEITAVVQPTGDIPGESWIARAWDPQRGLFLSSGGQDALDAALGLLEEDLWVRVHGATPRLAITGDSRVPRPPRSLQPELPVPARSSAAASNAAGAEATATPRVVATGPARDDEFGAEDDDAFG